MNQQMRSHNSQHQKMGQRGVSRPGHEMMPEQDKMKMLIGHHRRTLWVYWTIIILGGWMIVAPLTFSFLKAGLVEPAGGRAVWLELSTRLQILRWSDLISGALLVFLGFRTLKPNRPVSLWLACAVGIWLNAAPLIFWSPSPLIYLNDTLVGMLIIALTILIPGMPNMIHYMKMGPDVPKGWSYNPSSWAQRSILIALGFAGLLVSRYLAAFQLGYIDTAWDPFFKDSSMKVLTSEMSRSLPISDGGLGAFAYTFEFLMGWMGSPARWRTMPWMVTLFGILVIPLGLVHIFLVISQPVTVGFWCALCLLAAAVMLPMIPLEFDEVVAMIQFMRQSMREGKPFWPTFWKGGTTEGGGEDRRSPEMSRFSEDPRGVFRASLWGMSFAWRLVALSAIGIWLMFSPAIFGDPKAMADAGHLGGALILTCSVIAMGEPARALRFLNIPLALIILGAPFLISGVDAASGANYVFFGIVAIILSVPRGQITERFGAWDKCIV